MEKEIVNRVANSKLEVIDLEDFYPKGKRLRIDISQWLFEGVVLREKEFRHHIASHDWSIYKDNYVALSCSTDAIVPGWTYMLIAVHLAPYAKITTVGTLADLENTIFSEIIEKLPLDIFKDKSVIIKGCTDKFIPQNAYVLLTQRLQFVAKKIMYGEACSAVPIYHNK